MTRPKRYLTTTEAARILGVSTTTVRSYCRRDELTAYTDNFRRILISYRELTSYMREFNRRYYWYRTAMECYGWENIAEYDVIEHGTLCSVRIRGNSWERWRNQDEDAEPPDEIGAFYHRIIHIVPMGAESMIGARHE